MTDELNFVLQARREKLEALEPFHPDRMASRILGMGDVLSLIEKVETELVWSPAWSPELMSEDAKFILGFG